MPFHVQCYCTLTPVVKYNCIMFLLKYKTHKYTVTTVGVCVCVNISTADWSVRNTGFLFYSGKYVCVWGGRGLQQQDLMVLSCFSTPVLGRPHHGDQLDVGVGAGPTASHRTLI